MIDSKLKDDIGIFGLAGGWSLYLKSPQRLLSVNSHSGVVQAFLCIQQVPGGTHMDFDKGQF